MPIIAQRIVGIILLVAAISKIVRRNEFQAVLRESFNVRGMLLSSVTTVSVLAGELLIGFALLFNVLSPWANIGSVILLAVFTGAVIASRRREQNLSCGCFGAWKVLDSDGGWGMVLRNGGFAFWSISPLVQNIAFYVASIGVGIVLLSAALIRSKRTVTADTSS